MDTIDSITIIAAAWGLLVLRLTLALILWPHGAQKVLGWFGGAGWDGTYQAFTEKMGIPPFLAKVAMLTEFFAPIHQDSCARGHHHDGRRHDQAR